MKEILTDAWLCSENQVNNRERKQEDVTLPLVLLFPSTLHEFYSFFFISEMVPIMYIITERKEKRKLPKSKYQKKKHTLFSQKHWDTLDKLSMILCTHCYCQMNRNIWCTQKNIWSSSESSYKSIKLLIICTWYNLQELTKLD